MIKYRLFDPATGIHQEALTNIGCAFVYIMIVCKYWSDQIYNEKKSK